MRARLAVRFAPRPGRRNNLHQTTSIYAVASPPVRPRSIIAPLNRFLLTMDNHDVQLYRRPHTWHVIRARCAPPPPPTGDTMTGGIMPGVAASRWCQRVGACMFLFLDYQQCVRVPGVADTADPAQLRIAQTSHYRRWRCSSPRAATRSQEFAVPRRHLWHWPGDVASRIPSALAPDDVSSIVSPVS